VHPNAADENEIVDWTLRNFSKLEIKNKMLLLQYARDLNTTEVAEKRKLILGIANELSLKVIDTHDVLSNAKKNELWYREGSHHTPLGNELVCSYLFEQGFSKQADDHSDNLDGIPASFRLAAIVARCSAIIRFARSLTCALSTNSGCVNPSNMCEKSCTSVPLSRET
jgi:hypothetical protein